MKKKLLVAAIITLIIILSAGLVACGVPSDIEVPSPWSSYLQELGGYMYETFSIAEGRYSMTFNSQIKHIVDEELTTFNLRFDMTQDVSDPKKSGIELVCDAVQKDGTREEIFYLGATNSNIYLMAKATSEDYSVRYNFENTPIFELLKVDLVQSNGRKEDYVNLLSDVAVSCDINEDKSIYTLDVHLGKLMERIAVQWQEIFKLIPSIALDEINKIFNTDVSKWLQVLMDTTAKVQINTSNYKVISVDIAEIDSPILDDSSRIGNISIVDISVRKKVNANIVPRINSGKEDYIRTKIGAFSMKGEMSLEDSSTSRSAIKYTYEINSSLDLINLAANKFDFTSLSEDNYFHLRLMHKCGSSCTAFCNVQDGNKLASSKGAVLDIAYSPRDFGSKFIYISLGIKSLVGDNALQSVAGSNTTLLKIFLGDYILLTLDTAAYSTGGTHENTMNIVKMLLGLSSYIDIGKSETIIDLPPIFAALDIKDNKFVGSMLNCGGYNIDRVKLTYEPPYFGSSVDYDIALETLHIIDKHEPSTKNYQSILGKADPALAWDFYDADMVDVGGVSYPQHKIYYGDTPVSGKGINISPEEASNFMGHYIKYQYTDIYGKSEGKNAKAKIIEVQGLDRGKLNEYQVVTLKVALPSTWLDKNILSQVGDRFDSYMYATIKTAIKLTPLNTVGGIVINRTDRDSLGTVITQYRVGRQLSSTPMLKGQFTAVYADGVTKKVNLMGSCDMIRRIPSLLGDNYTIVNDGKGKVVLDYAGKQAEFDINIVEPQEVEILHNTTGQKDIFNRGMPIEESYFELFKLSYRYDYTGSFQAVDVPLGNYTINGIPLTESSRFWTVYQDEADGKNYIVFNIDGKYDVKLNLFGKVGLRTIIVTSRTIEASTYLLTDATANSNYFVGYDKEIFYNLTNEVHGATGRSGQVIDINLDKAYVTSSGMIAFRAITAAEGELKGLKYDGVANGFGDEAVPIDVPRTIYKAVPIKFAIKLNVTGYYRLTTKFAGERVEKFFEVKMPW